MQRSKYFRTLFQHHNGLVNVNIEDPIDIPTFSGFIRHLYTEELSPEMENFPDNILGRPTKALEVSCCKTFSESQGFKKNNICDLCIIRLT